MKRTYLLIFILIALAFAGCSAKAHPPALPSALNAKAAIRMGDFSFHAQIRRESAGVSLTVLDTRAEGLTLACDGKTVVFRQGDFEKAFDKNALDVTNPAIVIYEVFTCLESAEKPEAHLKGESYCLRGKTSIGAFELRQSVDGAIRSISIPDAKIEIEFLS